MSQLGYFEDRYGDGECGPFAQALHAVTGLPIVLLVLEEAKGHMPSGFPRHAVLSLKDGRVLDAFGIGTVEDAEARFECRLRRVEDPDLHRYPFESGPGGEFHSADDFEEMLDHARQMLDLRDLGGLVEVARGGPTA